MPHLFKNDTDKTLLLLNGRCRVIPGADVQFTDSQMEDPGVKDFIERKRLVPSKGTVRHSKVPIATEEIKQAPIESKSTLAEKEAKLASGEGLTAAPKETFKEQYSKSVPDLTAGITGDKPSDALVTKVAEETVVPPQEELKIEKKSKKRRKK